jgi:hypothetical protein
MGKKAQQDESVKPTASDVAAEFVRWLAYLGVERRM